VLVPGFCFLLLFSLRVDIHYVLVLMTCFNFSDTTST
jgi:hypothetical protein